MEFVDFRTRARSDKLDTLFPGWEPGETVAFLSPHDDDIALGAGYLLQAVLRSGGRPLVVIFCKGDAGYSRARDKRSIVATRRREAAAAYAALGVGADDILPLGLPDLSLMTYVNRWVFGRAGVVDRLVRLCRARRVTRAVLSSPHFENWDHTAAFEIGAYVVPQAGDPILADLGEPCPVRSSLVYSVWGDFGPPDGDPGGPRADAGILAAEDDEAAVRGALALFASQREVMERTVARRRDERRGPGGYLELYRRVALREPVDYAAYFDLLK